MYDTCYSIWLSVATGLQESSCIFIRKINWNFVTYFIFFLIQVRLKRLYWRCQNFEIVAVNKCHFETAACTVGWTVLLQTDNMTPHRTCLSALGNIAWLCHSASIPYGESLMLHGSRRNKPQEDAGVAWWGYTICYWGMQNCERKLRAYGSV